MRELEEQLNEKISGLQDQVNELQMENKSLRTQVNVDTIVGGVF